MRSYRTFLSGRTMVQMGNRAQKFVCYPISRAEHDAGRSLTNWIACVQAGEREALAPEDWNRRADPVAFLHRYDGWVDQGDIEAFMEGARPCPASELDPLEQAVEFEPVAPARSIQYDFMSRDKGR